MFLTINEKTEDIVRDSKIYIINCDNSFNFEISYPKYLERQEKNIDKKIEAIIKIVNNHYYSKEAQETKDLLEIIENTDLPKNPENINKILEVSYKKWEK